MSSKKAQGLPINFIILLIIALIVLVIIVLFATGTLGSLFKSTTEYQESMTVTEQQAARIKCSNWCTEAKAIASSDSAWKNSAYCNGNFTVNETKCWEQPIGVECKKVVKTSDELDITCCDTMREGCECSC